jgi:hypothetical protein
MLHRAVWLQFTDLSEERNASVIGLEERAKHVTSNKKTASKEICHDRNLHASWENGIASFVRVKE